MKKLILFIALCAFCDAMPLRSDTPVFGSFEIFHSLHQEPPPPEIPHVVIADNIGEFWIEQKLDHFDRKNNKTWFMRYLANNALYREDGPIFIYVGGEWEITPGWIQSGRFYDIAKEVGAFLVYTEHRYYGKSHPTEDTSVKNLKYLTVDQALADLAYFIDFLKANIPQLRKSKVILAGGSYAGSMAAWFKKEYPNKCAGAWASSAPVVAKADFFEYKEVVGKAYQQIGGQKCHLTINQAFLGLETLIKNNDISRIEQDFRLCFPMDVTQKFDIYNFFSGLSNIMAAAVQSARPGTIKGVCDILTHEMHEDPIAALAYYVRSIYGSSCFSHSIDNDVAFYKETHWNATSNQSYRQWIYQTCNEFGWYQTSGSKKQPFGSSFPLELYVELCERIYGEEFNHKSLLGSVKNVNKNYKGTKSSAKNVYYTNGEIDPWMPMGILKDRFKHSPADVIPEASHTMDLYSISLSDSPEMMMVKLRVRLLILEWLNGKSEENETRDEVF